MRLIEGELAAKQTYVIPDLLRYGLREVREKHEEYLKLCLQNEQLAGDLKRIIAFYPKYRRVTLTFV